MTRKRDIKPRFFKNEDIAQCRFETRLFFIGLWCWADRDGRLEDRPQKLRFEVLPYDNVDADALLTELHDHGFIIRYTAKGKKCIQIVSWKKHGNPHANEPSDDLPAPPDKKKKSRQIATNRDESGLVATPLLTTPLYIPLTPKRSGDGNFSQFWNAYPRHIAKAAAVKAWLRLDPSEELTAQIVAAIERQKSWPAWTKDGEQYIPHPATWLNNRRWEDEPPSGGGRTEEDIARDVDKRRRAEAEMTRKMRESGPVSLKNALQGVEPCKPTE